MRIKTIAKMVGIPEAEVAVSPMTLANGMPNVFMSLSAVAIHAKDVVCTLRLSPAEARDLAARLVITADAADVLAKGAA